MKNDESKEPIPDEYEQLKSSTEAMKVELETLDPFDNDHQALWEEIRFEEKNLDRMHEEKQSIDDAEKHSPSIETGNESPERDQSASKAQNYKFLSKEKLALIPEKLKEFSGSLNDTAREAVGQAVEKVKEFHAPFREDPLSKVSEDIRQSMTITAFVATNRVVEKVKELHAPYNEDGFSQISNEIWEAMNEIDDTPLGQLMHGVIYGATDTAIRIATDISAEIVQHLGSIFAPDKSQYNQLINTIRADIQHDVDRSGLSSGLKLADKLFLKDNNITPPLSSKSPREDSVDYLGKYLNTGKQSADVTEQQLDRSDRSPELGG